MRKIRLIDNMWQNINVKSNLIPKGLVAVIFFVFIQATCTIDGFANSNGIVYSKSVIIAKVRDVVDKSANTYAKISYHGKDVWLSMPKTKLKKILYINSIRPI